MLLTVSKALLSRFFSAQYFITKGEKYEVIQSWKSSPITQALGLDCHIMRRLTLEGPSKPKESPSGTPREASA